MALYIKDPDAILDYKVDWTAWLAGDTIATSTWTAPAGLTIASSIHDTTSATAWLSGGTLGETYQVTNHVVTTAGRADDRTISLRMQSR